MANENPVNQPPVLGSFQHDDQHQQQHSNSAELEKTSSTAKDTVPTTTDRPETIKAIEKHLLPSADAADGILSSQLATATAEKDSITTDKSSSTVGIHPLSQTDGVHQDQSVQEEVLPQDLQDGIHPTHSVQDGGLLLQDLHDGVHPNQSVTEDGLLPQNLQDLQENLKEDLATHIHHQQPDIAPSHAEQQHQEQQKLPQGSIFNNVAQPSDAAAQQPDENNSHNTKESNYQKNEHEHSSEQPAGVQTAEVDGVAQEQQDQHEQQDEQEQQDQQQPAAVNQDTQMEDTAHDPTDYDIEVDEWNGSDFSDTSSFLSSLSDSVTAYHWENGRRYHAYQGGRYPLPNDETELDREDMKHHEMMLITNHRLHFSPIPDKPQRILDIGTGTGIWAMQMADKYPSAEVVGTDLSPVQSDWVPPNLTFEIDDAEQPWLHKPDSYDLINIRFMFLAIKDFPKLIRNAYDTLKPGGWIELSELDVHPRSYDSVLPSPSQIITWVELLRQAARPMGFDMQIARKFKSMVIEAGFEEVTEEILEVPWGIWPKDQRLKEIGFWHKEQLKQGLQGIAMGLLTRSLGWTPTEVELFLVGLRKEIDDRTLHIIDSAYIVYGRKPLQ